MSDYTIRKVNNEFAIAANAPNCGAFAHGHTISFNNETGQIVKVHVWNHVPEKVHEFEVFKNTSVNLIPPDRWGQMQYKLTTRDEQPPPGAATCTLYTVVLDTKGTAHPHHGSRKGGVYHPGDTVWIKNSRNSTVEVTVTDLLNWSTTTIPVNGIVTGTIKNDAAGGDYKISFTQTNVGTGGSREGGGHSGGNDPCYGHTTGDGEIRVGSGPVNGGGDDE